MVLILIHLCHKSSVCGKKKNLEPLQKVPSDLAALWTKQSAQEVVATTNENKAAFCLGGL